MRLIPLAGAVALHALVLGLAALTKPAPSRAPALPPPEGELEIAIDVAPPDEAPTSAAGSVVASLGKPAAFARGSFTSRSVAPPAEGEPRILEAKPEKDGPPLVLLPRREVDLGLGGGIAREILRERRAAPRKESAGRLAEELEARIAARGQGRSAVAVGAAYNAARHAPPLGTAVFDVRADQSGRVISVTLVSFGSDEPSWRRVESALKKQLERRRMRVPAGARGLSATLRIERGALADPNRDRTKRGVALGQDSLGPKDVRDESTRASFEPGRLSPTTSSGGVAGGASPTHTSVVLLGERVL